jgi:hypothetical protein
MKGGGQRWLANPGLAERTHSEGARSMRAMEIHQPPLSQKEEN